MDTLYVLKYPNGKLVARHGMTGCLYPAEHISSAEFWKSAEAANKFRGVMNQEGITVHKVTITPV